MLYWLFYKQLFGNDALYVKLIVYTTNNCLLKIIKIVLDNINSIQESQALIHSNIYVTRFKKKTLLLSFIIDRTSDDNKKF
jgi:hypothetical protein